MPYIDQNLKLLQEIYPDCFRNKYSLQTFYKKDLFSQYNPLSKIILANGALRVCTFGNPCWSLEFNFEGLSHTFPKFNEIEINPEGNANEDWLHAVTKEGIFKSGSSPLYLSVILDGFRHFIEQKPFKIDNLAEYRAKIKSQNPLLCWLEELYFSYCEWDDWGYGYGALDIDIMSFDQCWVTVISMEEVDLCDKPFKEVSICEPEGMIELYKQGDKLVIKTHFQGLIKGLSLFKEWVES